MSTKYHNHLNKSRPLITEQKYLEYRSRLAKGKKYILEHGGFNVCNEKIVRAWNLMNEDCLNFIQVYQKDKLRQTQELMANIPAFPKLTTIDPEIGRMKLHKKGYIELAPGSYFKWIEKDWFERYKSVLRYTPSGAWIPSLSKLPELEQLNIEYELFQKQQVRAEYAQRMADKQREEIKQQINQEEIEI